MIMVVRVPFEFLPLLKAFRRDSFGNDHAISPLLLKSLKTLRFAARP
jgi:hypothetical protein